MNKNEIQALISLLEDPDHDIYSQVRSKLVHLGVEIIPDLENVWEMNFDSLIQNRAVATNEPVLSYALVKTIS